MIQERDKYINEASSFQSKAAQALEDIKVSENQIFDLRKKLADTESKLKQQQRYFYFAS